jgi:hypothetical protein
MPYCSTVDVRDLTDITTDDISDSKLAELIDKATKIIIEDLTIPIIDEELDGNIDGSNTTFSVDRYPIADVTGDSVVTGADVTVYIWGDRTDPSTRETVPVSTIYPRTGKIVLSSAPAATIEQVTCDYHYTYEEYLDWDLINPACVYLTAYLFYIKKYTVVPTSLARGPMRFRWEAKPYIEFLDRYYELLERIRKKVYVKKETDTMSLERSRM